MTRSPRPTWNEATLSELPAIALLRRLGYTTLPADTLEPPTERDSLAQPILTTRLATALQRLNPWLSAPNTAKAISMLTRVEAISLIDANRTLHRLLTYGESIPQDLGDGKRSHDFRFIDFESPAANDLLVVPQYRVRGARMTIKPDITLFVNGIPLAVIECKSPTLGDKWREDAITQLRRYQETDEAFRNEGAPALFHTAQVLVATCGEQACYGTTNTPARFYLDWPTPYPATLDELQATFGDLPQGIRAQERVLYSLLRPESLLDIVKNFVVFETENGRTVKKLCRYKQLIAANQAIGRVTSARRRAERGGVVWHTQGSGKSLTMLWLALKLRRDPRLQNPGLIIVTDRTSLDSQITGTFENAGFPVKRAESVRDLKDLVRHALGTTIMTTIQKFQELRASTRATAPMPAAGSIVDAAETERADPIPMPVLNEAENIVVMVDEAHRSQYRGLATNMRAALPNAAFIGFTGTPIDKKDKSTRTTFGEYIDKYTIEQAVADGATVPIYYEGRMAELRIVGNSLDRLFDREFSDRTPEDREAIKKRYATEQAISEAPKRIEAITLDIIEHFTEVIEPNGLKAQLAAVSRDAALAYHEALVRLHGPSSALVISSKHNDEAKFTPYALTDPQVDDLIKAFLDPGRDPKILVVCDRLLTGFDAPIEQALYLDKPLVEHNLLQAIARTNRRYEDQKTYGLVIDYWGVSERLQEALSLFTAADVQGAMTPKADELPRLEQRHQAALRFFAGLQDRHRLTACVQALADDDVFAEFDLAFRNFAQSLDMLYPDRRALRFVPDAKWLGQVRKAARSRADRAGPDMSDCGAKVQRLIEESVIAEGIQILVAQVPLLSTDFDKKLDALGSNEARASEMEHAIRHEIHVKLDEDPAFYESLRERLERIIEDYEQGRISSAEAMQQLLPLRTELRRGQAESADGLQLGGRGFAIFGLLRRAAAPKPTGSAGPASQAAEPPPPGYGRKVQEDLAQLRDLASVIDDAIDPFTKYVDWRTKEDVLKELRSRVARQLRVAGHEQVAAKQLAAEIVALAKSRLDPS